MPTDNELVEFLKEKYRPHVIVLAGSRANETYTPDSDWDLFLFCDEKLSGGLAEWNGRTLDITFHEWPKPKGWIFTNPYSPVWPAQVLFDNTQGVFAAILQQTKEVYDKGSLVAYPQGCRERLQKLDRWVGKIEKYQDNPEVQFYYAGLAYEAFVRVWFERRNLWPLPPAQALPFIKENDIGFWKLLSSFVKTNRRESAEIAKDITRQLQSI